MEHGGDLSDAIARFGGEPGAWLDLSTGINPMPWPLPDTLLNAGVHRLPGHVDDALLTDAARAAYRVPSSAAIVAAPGTQALIQWLPRLASPGSVAIDRLTYSEHARTWSDAGHPVVPAAGIERLPDDACHAVIVNPNNPDGRTAPLGAIERAARTLRGRGGWLVVDESFVDVVPDATAASLCADLPVVVLRSFGKFYGLAGLRLGFAIASPATIATIRRALGPWAVSGPALAIGAAALRDEAWANAMRETLVRQADRLDDVLRSTGGAIVGGTSLFRLIRHPAAAGLHERLARQLVWCRKFAGADDLLRFGLPGADHDFARLSAALA
jgi:cobalamin biosynthetic protein CobC